MTDRRRIPARPRYSARWLPGRSNRSHSSILSGNGDGFGVSQKFKLGELGEISGKALGKTGTIFPLPLVIQSHWGANVIINGCVRHINRTADLVKCLKLVIVFTKLGSGQFSPFDREGAGHHQKNFFKFILSFSLSEMLYHIVSAVVQGPCCPLNIDAHKRVYCGNTLYTYRPCGTLAV